MSRRKFHNMLNKHCIRIHSPTVIFLYIYFYKKVENVKYTTKDRPLVGCSVYTKYSKFDLFSENVACRFAINETDDAYNILL